MSALRIEPARADEIYYVAVNMRESDRREFAATVSFDDREDIAHLLVSRFSGRPEILAVEDGDKLFAIGGLVELRPNVATLLFYATAEMATGGAAITRYIKSTLFPAAIARGVHRIECQSIVGHDDAHRWIEFLGLKQEAPPFEGFGKNGEAFIQFAWVKDAGSAVD